jgi:hypothetical protein
MFESLRRARQPVKTKYRTSDTDRCPVFASGIATRYGSKATFNMHVAKLVKLTCILLSDHHVSSQNRLIRIRVS